MKCVVQLTIFSAAVCKVYRTESYRPAQ